MAKIVENFWILFDSCINTLWFVDPATVYMFSLITVHNYIMSWLILVLIFVFLMIGYIYTDFLYINSTKDLSIKDKLISTLIRLLKTEQDWLSKNGDNLFNTKVDLKKEESNLYYLIYMMRSLMTLVFFFKKSTLVNRFAISSYFVELYSNMSDLPKQIGVYSKFIKHKIYSDALLEKIAVDKKDNDVYSIEIVRYSTEVFKDSIPKYNLSYLFYVMRRFTALCENPFGERKCNVLDKTLDVSTSKSVINIMNAEKLTRYSWFKVDSVLDIIQNVDTKGKNIKKNWYIKEKRLQDSLFKGYYSKAIYYTNNFTSSYTKLTNLVYYSFGGLWKTGLTSSVKATVSKMDADFIRDYFVDRRSKLYYTLYTKTNTIPLGKTKGSVYQKQLAYSDFLDETSFEYLWSALPTISLANMLVPSVVLLFTSEDAGVEPVISMKVIGHQWYWEYDFEQWLPTPDQKNNNTGSDYDFVNQVITYQTDTLKKAIIKQGVTLDFLLRCELTEIKDILAVVASKSNCEFDFSAFSAIEDSILNDNNDGVKIIEALRNVNKETPLSARISGKELLASYSDELQNVDRSTKWSFFKYNFNSNLVDVSELITGEKRLLEVDNFVLLPMHTPIRVLVGSADVLHSWALNGAGIKVDAVPGRINSATLYFTRPGYIYGQCSELCGVNHGFMPIKIKAVTFEEYVATVGNYKSLI